MKSKIQIVIAVLVMVAAAYWGFTSIRTYQYSGSNIMFPVGSGYALVKNTGDAAMPIEMRSGERAASFRITSTDLSLSQSAKRQGTGREAYYTLTFDLPPGQSRIDVASGRDVQMIARGETNIDATVRPTSSNSVRWILIISGGLIVWGAYTISSATSHSWIAALRGRASSGNLQPKETTT